MGKISLVTPGMVDLKDKSLRQRGLELRPEEGVRKEQNKGQAREKEKARTWKQMEQLTMEDEINSISPRGRKPSI